MNIDDLKDTINDNSTTSISCESFEAFIVDYIDNNLTDSERKVFIQHLMECPPCKKYLKEYQKSISLSQSAFSNEAKTDSQEMPEELVQAILASRKNIN